METSWMGRYRGFVAELVRHSNITAKSASVKSDMGGVMLTMQEWQILEYIVEHRLDDDRMIHISEALEIPQSTFSRTVKMLCAEGLVDKYQMSNNRKNIILKPTARGIELYNKAFKSIIPVGFEQLFRALDPVSDEDLETVTRALREFNDNLNKDFGDHQPEHTLIKME